MRLLIIIAVLALLASFAMEQNLAQACAPGNETRPDDTTRCGCVTDMECEHGIRHIETEDKQQ